MTGTSIDGLDAALVRLEGRGLALRAELVRQISAPLGRLAGPLRAAANGHPMTAGEFAMLAHDFGQFHADVITRLVSGGGGRLLDFIAVHGQTIYHAPPISWQLIDPAPIEQGFECPVICDLRQADLAAGGQGAPITPLADWVMFRDAKRSCAIVNLGGFINITFLPRSDGRAASSSTTASAELEKIHGRDLCACNHLLDAIARKAFGFAYDEGGRRAMSGIIRDDLVNSLFDVLQAQRKTQRSLGTGDEAFDWVDAHLHDCAPADLAACACTTLARFLAEEIESFGMDHFAIDEIILAGGGTKNLALTGKIKQTSIQPARLSDEFGVPASIREAMAMAILGALRLDGIPITLPQVTGRTGLIGSDDESFLREHPADQAIP